MSQHGFRHNILEKRLIRFDKIHNVIYGNIIQSNTNLLWIWYLQIINVLTWKRFANFLETHMFYVFHITIYIFYFVWFLHLHFYKWNLFSLLFYPSLFIVLHLEAAKRLFNDLQDKSPGYIIHRFGSASHGWQEVVIAFKRVTWPKISQFNYINRNLPIRMKGIIFW